MERLEEEQTHLDMFVAAVESSVHTDRDIADLYDLLLRDYPNSSIMPMVSMAFQKKRPAAMMDYCRDRLGRLDDADCRMLLRQIDDPEIDDESVAMTLGTLRKKLSRGNYIAAFAVTGQTRPEAIYLAHQDFERSGVGSLGGVVGLLASLSLLFDDLFGGD